MRCTECAKRPAAERLGLSICVVCAGIIDEPELPPCTCKTTRISLGTISDRHRPHCRMRREYERQVREQQAIARDERERRERSEMLDRFGNDD